MDNHTHNILITIELRTLVAKKCKSFKLVFNNVVCVCVRSWLFMLEEAAVKSPSEHLLICTHMLFHAIAYCENLDTKSSIPCIHAMLSSIYSVTKS